MPPASASRSWLSISGKMVSRYYFVLRVSSTFALHDGIRNRRFVLPLNIGHARSIAQPLTQIELKIKNPNWPSTIIYHVRLYVHTFKQISSLFLRDKQKNDESFAIQLKIWHRPGPFHSMPVPPEGEDMKKPTVIVRRACISRTSTF